MATEAPKPAPRKVYTTPVIGSPSSSDLKDEDLYDDSSEGELQSLRSEVKRLKKRILELENQTIQNQQLNESMKQKEKEIVRQKMELENARKEGEKLKNELKVQEDALKKRDFELEMEKDMHIRRKKAMDEKEFRIREMEDDLRTKIQKFSASADAQNASTEELFRREKEVEMREVRLQRQHEDLKCFQDQLYEREGRLQQNEKILEEKFKSTIHKEQELKDQMQALDLHKQEGPPASAPAHVTTAPVRILAPSPPPPAPQVRHFHVNSCVLHMVGVCSCDINITITRDHQS